MIVVEVNDPNQKARSGANITSLTTLLKKSKERFVQKPNGMVRFSTNILSHDLMIDPTIKLITQKRIDSMRGQQADDGEKVENLLEANFVKEYLGG